MRKALTIILSVLLVVSMFVSCNQDDIIDDLFEPTYSIKVAGTIGHGTVSADKTNAHEGDTVTLTATPAEGYELSAFSVTDDKANAITVTDGSFTMPADNVTVGATFSKTAETINQEAAAAVTTKIGAIGTVSYTAESKAKIDEARSAYDALNAAQKVLIPAETLAILTTAESSYSTQKAAAEAEAAANQAAADAVTTKINAIGEVTYTAESKTKIDDARSAYDALTDAQKALIPAETLAILTTAESSYSTQKAAAEAEAAANQAAADAVTTKINAIGEVTYTAESKTKIDDARSAYDALTDAQKALIPAETLAILTTAESSYSTQKAAAEEAAANQAAADAVTTKINAIGEVSYTAESKAKIDDARSAYDALTDAQKALIPAETLTILTTAESSYSTQKAAVDTVVAKIGAIGTVTYTAESKTKIDEARTSYDALTDSQKALVPAETLAVLTKAETDYNALKTSADEAAANQAAADAVIAKINAIGMVAYTTESKTKIDEARTAYDALTEAQKALVSAETLSVLTAAETKYAELKAAAEQQTAGSISYVTTTVSKTTDDAAFTNELTKTGDGTVSYSSSDANVATVNATTGEVTIVGAGTATITATVTDSASYTYATKTASYTVKVLSETLLTTITATGQEQASYSTENVATVSFSYTANGSSSYYNNGTTNWGWWGYGWIATVTPVNGYTITKCVFYDDKDRTATDSEAPFVVETTEEDKAPQVNGTPILAYQSKGITKIEVYGYVNP